MFQSASSIATCQAAEAAEHQVEAMHSVSSYKGFPELAACADLGGVSTLADFYPQ